MAFRDDREALRNKVESLQHELGQARKEAAEANSDAVRERTAMLEKELVGVEEHVARLRNELDALKPRRPSAAPAIAVMGVLALGGAVAYLLLGRAASKPPTPPVREAPRVVAQPPEPPKPAEPPEPPKQVEPQQVAAEPPAPPRQAVASWTASVTRANGLSLPAGSRCTVEARLAWKGTNASVKGLSMHCGKTKLYSSDDALNGTAMMKNDAIEAFGAREGETTFSLQYSDIGSRSGARGQVDLDTKLGKGVAFREGLDGFRVEFSVPRESAAAKTTAEVLRLEGRVTKASGSAPAKEGAACVLRAFPTGHRQACLAEVVCGKKVVLSSKAQVTCSYEGVKVVGVQAAESPSFAFDAKEPAATVKGSDYELGIDFGGRAGEER